MSDCWGLQMQATRKSVLISLADNANDDGLCWPSIATICERTCLSIRAVQDALGWLEESQVVRRIDRAGRSNHFYITPKAYTPAPAAPRIRRTPQQVHPTPAASAPQPPQEARIPPAPAAPITVIEPSLEPSKEPSVVAKAKKTPLPTKETWGLYAMAYFSRYRVDPVRNQTVNSQMAQFVSRIGQEEAPQVAAFYVHSNAAFYVQCGHSVGIMLRDAEKLRMEWATGRQITQTRARQQDQTASNPFVAMLEQRRLEGLTNGK